MLSTKVLISSIITLGGVGAIVTGGYFFMQPKNLKEDLEKEGIKILDFNGTNNKEWEKIAIKFKDTNNPVSNTNIKKLENVGDISKDSDNGIAKIKKQCEILFNKAIENTENYKKLKQSATDWCTYKSEFLK